MVVVDAQQANLRRTAHILAQLASGWKVPNPTHDMGSAAAGTQFNTSATIYDQVSASSSEGSTILGSADSALAQIVTVLQRMASFAQQATSATLTAADRNDLANQFTQLQAQLSSIVNGTTYSGQSLLQGSFTVNSTFPIGGGTGVATSVAIPSVSAGSLLAGTSLASVTSAQSAVTQINTAYISVTGQQTQVQAYQSQFDFLGQLAAAGSNSATAAAATLLDVDVAAAKARLAAQQVINDAALSAEGQAGRLTGQLLKLIQYTGSSPSTSTGATATTPSSTDSQATGSTQT